jgi:hypothetical protein
MCVPHARIAAAAPRARARTRIFPLPPRAAAAAAAAGRAPIAPRRRRSRAALPRARRAARRLALADKYAIVRSIGAECIQARPTRTHAHACTHTHTAALSLRSRARACLFATWHAARQEDELRNLLDKKPNPVAYDGFEPSGRMHIAQARARTRMRSHFHPHFHSFHPPRAHSATPSPATSPPLPHTHLQGVMKALNVNKLTKAGVTFKFWVADWFALMNNKMGGDLAKIQTVGAYMVEVWKAVGMDMTGGRVQFLSSSEEINARAAEYWPLVLDIARKNSLARVVRCSQIMGRAETDELAGVCAGVGGDFSDFLKGGGRD